jgi:hypothetical protein
VASPGGRPAPVAPVTRMGGLPGSGPVPSMLSRPSSAPYSDESCRGTTHSVCSRGHFLPTPAVLRARSPGRARTGRADHPRQRAIAPVLIGKGTDNLGPKTPLHVGRKTQNGGLVGTGRTNVAPEEAAGRIKPAGSASADSERMSQAPLAAGILELSAEAHTPAIAIRRKIAKAVYFHASQISNTELRNLFSRVQTSDSSWSSANIAASRERSRS